MRAGIICEWIAVGGVTLLLGLQPGSASAAALLTYSWVTGSFGSCSASCGGGTQSRTVICQDSNGVTVADSNCTPPKPATSQACNTQPCVTYAWVTGSFGSCSASCGGGTQSRTVICQDSNGVTVADSNCTPPKPATSQTCNTQPCATDTPTVTPTVTPTPTATPDEGGFIPPDANTGLCENRVAMHLKTLFACMTSCQIKQANAARKGKVFDEEACEQGTGTPISCRAAYDKAQAALLAKMVTVNNVKQPICPPCLDATAQSNLADGVVNLIESNNAHIYCAGTTPLP